MRHTLGRIAVALLLVSSLTPKLVLPQEPSHNETRPRRVPTTEQPSTTTKLEEWKAQTSNTISVPTEVTTQLAKSEPTIRVALSTDARSGTISTTSKLMNATGSSSTFIALNTARVRVEPHLLSPLPPSNAKDMFLISVGGAASRAEAEAKEPEVEEAVGAEPQIVFDQETGSWGLLVKKRGSLEEANETVARLTDAGFDARLTPPAQTEPERKPEIVPTSDRSNVRLASRPSVPSREVLASAAGSPKLFSSSAPVLFASDDETKAPVRFNDRPYRGRIEVFTNTRGNLTVVNVIGLEDYVRGVVANELSPGGYPALDALKAQAVAARTYALRNRGQFISQGFDLLPTTRSQVYRGLSSENALSTRAVDETRGIIATYNGEPINALYTSTCGGRTEDAENIFNQAVPYLRGRECAAEGQAALTPFTIQSTRELPDLREEQNVSVVRAAALLSVQNFVVSRTRVSDSWLSAEAPVNEIRSWLANVATLAHQVAPAVTEDVNHPGPFATALNRALYGETHADVLLDNADVEYFLAIRDAAEVPASNRADVAALVRDGYLSVYPDATLRPRDPISRARALNTIARVLEARGLLQLQKGTARPSAKGGLILRSVKGKDQPLRVSSSAFLFRQIADAVYPVKSVALVGGEPVVYHINQSAEVDYLEVKPAPNGASAERFSPFTNWSTELSLGQVQGRLGRAARGIGPLTDVRVASRGVSRRVIDLEVVGTQGSAHVRGGRIRSALGLREQLFTIERKFDDSGRVTGFVFAGRGWGHGVGMCQVGAYGLAKQGWTYDQILKAYYTGIELTKMY